MTLASKIATASNKVGALAADKRNTDQEYNYISADKILARAGDALADEGVAIFPSITASRVDTIEYVKMWNGQEQKKSRLDAYVTFEMVVSDGETEIRLPWSGCGSDYVTPDKALYKAITSGHKYFLAKLLNIGIGNEDGEHESGEEQGAITGKPAQTPQSVQMTTEDGLPVVDEEGQPVMTTLPAGTFKFAVLEVYHAKNKDGNKDLLKVVLADKWEYGNGKYGITCFHAPEKLSNFKEWELDKRYKAPAECAFVIVRAPAEGGKFPEVVEFRAA